MNQYRTSRNASGAITAAGLTMSTARLLGRTTGGTGAVEELGILSNNGLTLSAGFLGIDRALQPDMESPTTGHKLVASTAMIYHPGVAKAHVRFGPNGVASGTSYNVSSITDHGPGDWTINLNGAFTPSNSNGTIVLTVDHSAPMIAMVHARTGLTSYQIRCYDLTGTLADPTFINFAIYTDL